jgi:hypothetical protein
MNIDSAAPAFSAGFPGDPMWTDGPTRLRRPASTLQPSPEPAAHGDLA